MWAIAVAMVDGIILMLVMSLVGLWIWSQFWIWRTREVRPPSRSVTRAVWP
jgi:hypothetical protein